MLTFYLLIAVAIFFPVSQPQSCNPAVVNYIVRDEHGKVLSQNELTTVVEALPKSIGDAQVSTYDVSFASDGKTFYAPEQVEWPNGRKDPSLEFANAATCTMKLTEITLSYHGKKMRLIFNREIPRNDPGHRLVIDSLPFQSGTFVLNLDGWKGDLEQLIPANRWKKMKRQN